ncbi:hypothetical protein SAMN04488028_101119 [Reichenbachiella agariperforans]|uniref:Uncharacterized protein n=1 Tax=Reichenbachiella agariperforans TaxID=156994 RepID=A0A1M6JB61_REIAG|nr:hypothetical protein SAMN04488028_101119 [Reichenbachiella agariperforans]
MKNSKFTESLLIKILKEQASGRKVTDVYRMGLASLLRIE